MLQKIKNYLTIFTLEMEDLEEDIKYLIKKVEKKKANGELTNFVFMENQAILKNEIHAIECFKGIVKRTNPDDFRNIDGLLQYLREEFKLIVDTNSYAEAILIFTDRKMNKVKTYVLS